MGRSSAHRTDGFGDGHRDGLRLGLNLMATDRTWDIAELARAAETRGFDSLWLAEHTHIPTSRRTPPATGAAALPDDYKRTLDPLVALTAAAAATDQLRLGTGVLLPAQREPLVTAKAIATLDHIARGRVDLGVGFGWNEDEMEDHGVTYRSRRAIAREHVLAMQALWSEDQASFDGDHVTFPPTWSWPKPVQARPDGRRGVPVLLGGAAGPKLFSHIVEYGAGWAPFGGSGLSDDLPRLRRTLAEAGRDP